MSFPVGKNSNGLGVWDSTVVYNDYKKDDKDCSTLGNPDEQSQCIDSEDASTNLIHSSFHGNSSEAYRNLEKVAKEYTFKDIGVGIGECASKFEDLLSGLKSLQQVVQIKASQDEGQERIKELEEGLKNTKESLKNANKIMKDQADVIKGLKTQAEENKVLRETLSNSITVRNIGYRSHVEIAPVNGMLTVKNSEGKHIFLCKENQGLFSNEIKQGKPFEAYVVYTTSFTSTGPNDFSKLPKGTPYSVVNVEKELSN